MPHGEDTMSYASWAMNLISLGVIGTIGFLVKNSFTRMQSGLEIIQSQLSNLTGDKRAMEVEIRSLNHRVTALEEEVRDLRLKG